MKWWADVANSVSVEVDLSDTLAQLSRLEQAAQQGLRKGVYAGAKFLRLEVEVNAPMSQQAHIFRGKTGREYLFYPGDLRKSIYIKYVPENSRHGVREEYRVGYRENPSALGYVPYAHMVEYGTVKTPPVAFLRGTYESNKVRIMQIIEKSILESIEQHD